MIGLCPVQSKISCSGKVVKDAEGELISSFERHKKQKSTKRYCIKGGSSDHIELGPVIRVSALLGGKKRPGLNDRGIIWDI